MPNLQHDPQNPSDLLGQPLAKGDIVAWGTTYGRSPALCVARIEKIRFTKENLSGPYGTKSRKECPRHEATDYTLSIRPIVSTGDVTWVHKGTSQPWYTHLDGPKDPELVEAKLKTVHIVKNVVKIELP